MSFIEKIPYEEKYFATSSQVRLAYTLIKYISNNEDMRLKDGGYYRVRIYIGKDLADKVGINDGDIVSFSYDEENKNIWLIKKGKKGYKIRQPGASKSAKCLLMSPTLHEEFFTPEEGGLIPYEVHHEICDGGIKIDSSIIK